MSIEPNLPQGELASWYARGQRVLPGGVCSSTRLNQALGRPLYAAGAHGPRFWDLDDNEYLDMSMSHGATLLGHAPACFREVFETAWEQGVLCSFDTPAHVRLAEKLCALVPCGERVRFTNSGTEATLHALRLCRAASGRDKIIRFSGHFHGYHDFTLIGGHPPAAHVDDVPPYRESAGIPRELAELVVAVEYNDFAGIEAAVLREKDRAGTILIEPVDYNCGCITPQPGFLEHVRALADQHGMILFFDEIQSFAKKSAGGAQQDFGVLPDLCTIGKSLGAGLPLSAIVGRAELLERFKPNGPVAHSGTFNAPLLSMLSGLAFVEEIESPEFWQKIESLGARLYAGLAEMAARSPLPVRFQHHGSRFSIIFGTREPVTNYRQSLVHSPRTMLEFCRRAAERGVYFHDYGGSACHHGYSLAHEPADIDLVLDVVETVLHELGSQ